MIETLEKTGIRKAEYKDTDSILLLIMEFYEESLKEYGLSFDEDTLRETIKSFIDNHILLVAEEYGKIAGLIGGLIANSNFDKRQKVAQEFMWYVTKEKRQGTIGIRLLKTFEKKCKELGADFISMISMANLEFDKLDNYYRIKNFKLTEIHYLKGV